LLTAAAAATLALLIRPGQVLGQWTKLAEVYARGRAMRETVDHHAHRNVFLAPSRPEVSQYVEASNEGRLPELIPLCIGRMAASPFAFLPCQCWADDRRSRRGPA
jgi:hypothetical protein